MTDETTPSVTQYDYSTQSYVTIKEQIYNCLIATFPEYITTKSEYQSIYLYLCQPLQRDLNITTNAPMIEFYITHKTRRRGRRDSIKSQYKIEVTTSPYTFKRKHIPCEFKVLDGFKRRAKFIVNKLKDQLNQIELRRKEAEEKRLLQEKEQTLRIAEVQTFFNDEGIEYRLESPTVLRLNGPSDLRIDRVDEDYVYLYSAGSKRISRVMFKAYLAA